MRRRRRALGATFALACAASACNALIGLDGDFSLAGRAPDTTDASGDATPETSVPFDAGVDADPVDASYGLCWSRRSDGGLTTNDAPRWPIPAPKNFRPYPSSRQASYRSDGGAVRDLVTGLDWVLDVRGANLTRPQAESLCRDAGARLPHRVELTTIQDWWRYQDGGRVPDEVMTDFATPPANVWTDTPFQGGNTYWTANFEDGFSIGELGSGTAGNAKCVRDDGVDATAPVYELSELCGLFRDHRTGLEWTSPQGEKPFGSAESYCPTLESTIPGSQTANGDRWRLPTYAEAMSILDTTAATPALVAPLRSRFQNIVAVWTSSPSGADRVVVLLDAGRTATRPTTSQGVHTLCVHVFDP